MAKNKVEKDTSERWLLTYADLMNLLLILFIILYCSSQINAKKAAEISESMQEGFGNKKEATDTAAPSNASGDGSGTSEIAYWTTDEYGILYKEIMRIIQEENLADKVEAKIDNTGVVISFKDTALFAVGNATLSDGAVSLIDQIGSLLYGLNYSFILVEGHTDSDPIKTAQFQDNMALSSERAGNVWRELVKTGLAPETMASIGYGEYRPIVDNDSAENKAKNRRVVITILKHDFSASSDVAANDVENGTSDLTVIPENTTNSPSAESTNAESPMASVNPAQNVE